MTPALKSAAASGGWLGFAPSQSSKLNANRIQRKRELDVPEARLHATYEQSLATLLRLHQFLKIEVFADLIDASLN
jgi:hypothetical protein